MGIKNFKEHFAVEAIISKQKDGIHIGTGYVCNILTIHNDYTISHNSITDVTKEGEWYSVLFNKLTKASKDGTLKNILQSKDEYSNLMDVYTYKDGKVVKEQCEVFGYPNITTSGELMYDNTHYKTRKEAWNDPSYIDRNLFS